MAAGEALLALAGPVGWAIAGVALLGGGAFFIKDREEKKRIEDVFTSIGDRDAKSYELAIVELGERIGRIDDEEVKIEAAIERVSSFGLDYSAMAEGQQYELGSYVNLMNASAQLLVNPILGLQPRYTDIDLDEFADWSSTEIDAKRRALIIQLCNLLYHIDLDDKDRKLLYKTIKKNKELLSRFGLEEVDSDESIM